MKTKTSNNQNDWFYSPMVKDHFFNPRNLLLDEESYKADAIGVAGNAVCGDMMKVWIKVDHDTQRIKECKWKTFGCASAIAATSMMSVIVTEKSGMKLSQARNLKPQQIIKRLGGLPDRKFHCSVMGEEALKDAIKNYLQKH